MTRHYAYVPGVGAFMLQNVSGEFDSNKHRFIPPHRKIRFNTLVSHDDNMLASIYMMADGLSYDEACAHIRYEVAQLHTTLNRDGKVQLGHLGELSFDSEQHLVFTATTQHQIDTDHYGFSPITLPTWQSLEEKKIQPKPDGKTINNDTILIPVSKHWLKHIAIVILVIGCFFSNFSSNSDPNSHFASVIDHTFIAEGLHLNTLTQQSWDDIWEEDSTYQQILSDTLLSDLTLETATSADSFSTATSHIPSSVWLESKTVKTLPDSEQLMNTSPNGKLYYIIVASCSSAEEASRVMKRLQKKGYEDIGILERDNRFRLYINYFAIKGDAEHYLLGLRTNEIFHDAWLLPVRANSLSHIKKNQNNEHLPMELSNPNPRTEREQG